jgi:hypothetical protein
VPLREVRHTTVFHGYLYIYGRLMKFEGVIRVAPSLHDQEKFKLRSGGSLESQDPRSINRVL